MEGDLDRPPVIIRSSQRTSLLFLIVSLGAVAGGVLMLRDATQNTIVSYFTIIFFGAGIPIFAWRLVRPDVLTVSPDGITWRSAFRTAHLRWDDLQRFRAYSPTSSSLSKHLGFDFTEGYDGQSKGLRQSVKSFTGVDGSLGGGWELNSADLAVLLNAARARWAPAFAALK